MGSTSSTLAALIRVCSLSACIASSQRPSSTATAGQFSTYGDLDAIVGEDQRRVGRSELGVRHCEVGVVVLKCLHERSLLVVECRDSNGSPNCLGHTKFTRFQYAGLEDLKVGGRCVFPAPGARAVGRRAGQWRWGRSRIRTPPVRLSSDLMHPTSGFPTITVITRHHISLAVPDVLHPAETSHSSAFCPESPAVGLLSHHRPTLPSTSPCVHRPRATIVSSQP